MGNNLHITDERLDEIGAELVRACSASAEEVEQAAASPFLYRRIQAHIAAEQRRRDEEENIWFALWRNLRHALPALALVAAFTIGGALFAARATPVDVSVQTAEANNNDALFFDNSDELTSELLSPTAPVEVKRK